MNAVVNWTWQQWICVGIIAAAVIGAAVLWGIVWWRKETR